MKKYEVYWLQLMQRGLRDPDSLGMKFSISIILLKNLKSHNSFHTCPLNRFVVSTSRFHIFLSIRLTLSNMLRAVHVFGWGCFAPGAVSCKTHNQ